MTREEFYKSERDERDYYSAELSREELLLPVTYDGFEALLESGAAFYELPVDDRLRSLLAGYIHHIPSEKITINFNEMCNVIYKSYVNSMTFEADQQAKARAAKEVKTATVTPIRGPDSPPSA